MAMADDTILCPTDIVKRCVGLAVDIGGSVVKMVYRSKGTWQQLSTPDGEHPEYTPLHLFTCSRDELSTDILHQLNSHIHLSHTHGARSTVYICGLGDGILERKIKAILDIELTRTMEMDGLIDALTMILKHFPRQDLFQDSGPSELGHLTMLESTPDLYPCMLLNFGSSFGYNLLHKEDTPKLMNLSPNGGRYFMGLSSVLLGIKSHRELLELALHGDMDTVDQCLHPRGKTQPMEEALPSIDSLCSEDLALYLYKSHIRTAAGEIHHQCVQNNISHFFMAGNYASHALVRRIFSQELHNIDQAMTAVYGQQYFPQLHFLKASGHLCALGTLLKSVGKAS